MNSRERLGNLIVGGTFLVGSIATTALAVEGNSLPNQDQTIPHTDILTDGVDITPRDIVVGDASLGFGFAALGLAVTLPTAFTRKRFVEKSTKQS